jgi:branched-chain amino acid transport system ATP-binding protein
VTFNKMTASASAPLLELEGIDLSFGGVRAIADVSIAVEDGAICAIIGPNGAGKSSLLNVISGLYRPEHGTIRFAGQSYPRLTPGEAARIGIARTFQNIALFTAMTVVDNIVMGRAQTVRANFLDHAFGLPRARLEERNNRERAEEIIDFLGIRQIRHSMVATLPYGLQKRVELARALVASPRLLLLDEPMAGMNLNEKREMCRYILDAHADFGVTVILIEHDIGVVMELAEHIIVLDYGEKIGDGTPDEIRRNQRVIQAYLGVETPREVA